MPCPELDIVHNVEMGPEPRAENMPSKKTG